MPLSALPKAFVLSGNTTKGTFPHLFNTPENQNYVGPLPDLKYYSSDYMRSDERERFLLWYNETKRSNYIFHFKKEIVSYCKNDVTILRRACLAFRKMFIKCGNVCPFEESTTIASACSRVYRKNFLQKNMIGIIPTGGYRWGQNQSRKAISWLTWMEHELGHIIAHAGNGRETRLPEGVLVDGYYEEIIDGAVIKHVLQFHGCYWHGCPRCYTVNRTHGISTDTMDVRLERTQFITAKIESAGYILTEMWECDFDRILISRKDMRIFLENRPKVSQKPLNPRDAFYGGRTENMVSLYDVKGNEKIHYVDVCSLYPYICKTGKFPVKHPTIYVGEEYRKLTVSSGVEIDKVEGLVYCTILPPRMLYHPVLPVRMHGKLMFALCRSCCENMYQEDCIHEDTVDREFTGTWVADEIRKAVSVGYKIINIYEIWQYEMTQYNPETKEGGHFTEYINTFLKIKQEASGWPSDCIDNEELKMRYIDEYEQMEGIKLDPQKIYINPGLRAVSKICLNSFWGKFGQRENLPKVEIVTTRNRLIQLLSSNEINVISILPVNDDVLYVSYICRDENLTSSPITNVVIAAFTTAQARLKLYEYLERLGNRALYCDTDSCIYVSGNSPNDYDSSTGKLLGDLTIELTCYDEGSYIESFVSAGPKFYAFVVRKPDGSTTEVCKAKGVTLNFANNKLINYRSVRELVTNELDISIVLCFDAIKRTKFHNVVTSTERKTCKQTFDKRRRENSYGSLPYGYCNL
ncbi:putative DNA polymerase [Cyphomyrmex costatus]|uniref:DNA-directed DNA polymerase n=1 Tax=Cyphomyrmex costatus TaxID=456900 RepID=A0A151II04_9HYME|nr:putative DNA polymerase [Cyphomyrmex costatus]